MVNEQIKADGTLVSIDVWRDDPSKVRIFIKDRDTIIIPRNYLYEMRQCIDDLSGGEGYKFEPQESNKELVEWAYVSEKYCVICSTGIDVRILKLPLCDRHFKESNEEEEQSKKPSMTIGCMECGNNIEI